MPGLASRILTSPTVPGLLNARRPVPTTGAMKPSRLASSSALAAARLPVARAAPGTVTLVRAAGPRHDRRRPDPRNIWRMHGATRGTPIPGSAAAPTRSTARPRRPIRSGSSRTRRHARLPRHVPAADFGNPAYRAWWIAQAVAAGRRPARALRRRRVHGAPRLHRRRGRDQRPRPAHRDDHDRGQLAALHGGLHGRAARPRSRPPRSSTTSSGTRATRAPTSLRELAAASAVAIEKGFNDPAIVGGSGTYGWETLAGFVERRQAAGRGVILDGYADAPAARLYGLAALAPARHRHDRPRQRRLDRADPLLDRLRRPTSARPSNTRYAWSGVWRRDFANGSVLVNPPGNGDPQRRARRGLRRPRRRRPERS